MNAVGEYAIFFFSAKIHKTLNEILTCHELYIKLQTYTIIMELILMFLNNQKKTALL